MRVKQRAEAVCDILFNEYPVAECTLNYSTPLELLIATRLSAQCTDKRVNIVTPALFSKYKTAADYAEAEVSDIEDIIRPCGFYRAKAKSIKEMSAQLTERFGGSVPDSIDELTALSGVGRKTANLIVGELYGKPAVVADTHCIRLSGKIGLCDSDDPYKVELALEKLIKPELTLGLCHRLVNHGRLVCTARSPKCEQCCIREYCLSYHCTQTKAR